MFARQEQYAWSRQYLQALLDDIVPLHVLIANRRTEIALLCVMQSDCNLSPRPSCVVATKFCFDATSRLLTVILESRRHIPFDSEHRYEQQPRTHH